MTFETKRYVAALVRERRHMEVYHPERVAAIDAELARHGFGPNGKPLPPVKPVKPEGRHAPEHETASAPKRPGRPRKSPEVVAE